jgi:hypothetical protein
MECAEAYLIIVSTNISVTNICLHRYIGGIGDKYEGCAGG